MIARAGSYRWLACRPWLHVIIKPGAGPVKLQITQFVNLYGRWGYYLLLAAYTYLPIGATAGGEDGGGEAFAFTRSQGNTAEANVFTQNDDYDLGLHTSTHTHTHTHTGGVFNLPTSRTCMHTDLVGSFAVLLFAVGLMRLRWQSSEAI